MYIIRVHLLTYSEIKWELSETEVELCSIDIICWNSVRLEIAFKQHREINCIGMIVWFPFIRIAHVKCDNDGHRNLCCMDITAKATSPQQICFVSIITLLRV